MHGYFFTAITTRAQIRASVTGRGQTKVGPQVWTGCDSAVVYASDREPAQNLFETWLCRQPEGENPLQTRINKIVSVQFLDQLLTETGNVPVDWPQLNQQFQADLAANPADDFEPGYWLDINIDIRPGSNLETMRQALPADIRSGLNWSAEKQYYFQFSVFKAPPVPVYDPATNLPVEPQMPEPVAAEDAYDFETGLVASQADAPELADKAAAVLIRARNAAVAIWLWRNYSARGKLAQNPICLDPWLGAVGVDSV